MVSVVIVSLVLLSVFLFLTPWGEECLWELGIISETTSGKYHRLYSNESSAASGLRTLICVEAVWMQQGADRNGTKDYWTYDVSTFFRMYRPDGSTLVQGIDLAFARADGQPHADDIFGPGITQDWTGVMTTTAKSGYYYRAMVWDENGNSYNQNEVGDKKVKSANQEKFAFVAYPAIYAITGVRTYIVNQGGTIYAIDPGSDKDKIILRWPGADPTQVTGPGGTNWHVAD